MLVKEITLNSSFFPPFMLTLLLLTLNVAEWYSRLSRTQPFPHWDAKVSLKIQTGRDVNGQAHREGWGAERATTQRPWAHVKLCCWFPQKNPVRVLQPAVNRQAHDFHAIVWHWRTAECFVRKVFWKKVFFWLFQKLLSLTSRMSSKFESTI